MLLLVLLLLLPLLALSRHPNNASLLIVSDIDDVLRQTELWNPTRAYRNIFEEEFKPTTDFPELYHDWSDLNGTHFAYVTDALASWADSYMHGIRKHYPDGEISFRMFKLLQPARLLKARQMRIQELVDSHPNASFVLVGDFATPGLINAYANAALKNPKQVQCLFFIDVRATNPANHFVPATKPLANEKLANRWTVLETAREFRNESLAYLQALNDTTDQNFGCERLLHRQHAFLELVDHTHYGEIRASLMTLAKGVIGQIQCLMLAFNRPSPLCRFDRREGTWYPAHQKWESQGELRDWKILPNTIINGTKYDTMCYQDGNFYVVNGTCPDFNEPLAYHANGSEWFDEDGGDFFNEPLDSYANGSDFSNEDLASYANGSEVGI